MSTADDNQFVHNYSKVLVQAWTDPSFMSSLKANPAAVLKGFGIVVPSGATVDIIQTDAKNADLQAQIKAWDAGKTSNKYTLYIPSSPQLGIHQGADGLGLEDTSYCCCCCPCCTCT